MPLLEKIEYFLQNRKIIFLILFAAVFFQFVFSFVFPSYDLNNDYWKTVEQLGSYKSYSYDSFSGSILAKIYPLVSHYHIWLDSAAYILLAHDFPGAYFKGVHTFLNRPLFSFLVSTVSLPLRLINDSYFFTFAAGLFVNFFLFFFAAILFYLLVKKIVSNRVAILSSLLLIFSPFARVWLVQPSAEILGAFAVVLALYLLYDYANSPSVKKLALFSFIAGVLMLGKMLFAIPFFILALAVFFKRYKEGLLFILFFLAPGVIWYVVVTKIFGMDYYSGEMTDFNMYLINGWFLNVFNNSWPQTAKIILDAAPSFIFSLVYGFLLLPVILAVIGFGKLQLKEKKVFCFGFLFSFFVLFLAMNYYTPRHAFLMFPVVYPLAVLGMDGIGDFLKKKGLRSPIFYLMIFATLIVVSEVNVFRIFSYDAGFPWMIKH